MALPRLTEEGGFCPPLEPVVGKVEGPERWADFLAANSRTAREFGQAWGKLRLEAAGLSNLLGRELTGPLASPVQSAGEPGTSSRQAITASREDLRHHTIIRCLEQHPDRLARPVFAYQNLDKLSDPWIQALPGPHTGLSAAVFAEALAARLCLPSPVVVSSGKVGKPVCRGGPTIDPFGDAINDCRKLCGDTWRHRHDTAKAAIARECLASKLPHDVEVYGLFAHLLPAVATQQGSDLEWSRARQGLVPDYRLRLQTPEGTTDVLAELKVLGAGITWHPRGKRGTGVERRAATLAGYYRRGLAKYDRKYHGTADGETGPLVRLLESYGKLEALVVGPWGNGSKDLHNLVRTLAETRVGARTRARGREGPDWELGEVMGQIRRNLSLDFVRAQALCLIARIGQLGEGAQAAGKRREQAVKEEERRKRERLAHHLAHVRGRGLGREGEIYVPS